MVAAAAFLALLVGAMAPPAMASSAPAGGWWNDAYQYRRAVTVTNGGTTPMVNQTVLLHLNFTGNDVEDPIEGVRLVDSSGNEVPSAVAGPTYSGIFLRSAYFVFLANVPPKSAISYYLYYGSAFQSAPSYRPAGPTSSLDQGFVDVTQEAVSTDSTQLRISLGSVDSETMMSKVSYGSGSAVQDYGPAALAATPFSNDTGLVLAGMLNPQTAVAYESVIAGAVQLTQIVMVTPTSALTVEALSNGGSSTVRNVALDSVVGLGGLTALGSSFTSYNDRTGLLYTRNPDAYFGVQQSSGASSFGLGTVTSVTAQALAGVFSGGATYTLATAAGFAWNLGDLLPMTSEWVSSSWGVAADVTGLGVSLPAVPLGASLGEQEVLGIATPQARSIWLESVTLDNVGIPTKGVNIPLGFGGAQLVPGASSVSGTYTYSVPPSPAQDASAWTAATSSTGNSTAFASSEYYSFDEGQNVQRISGIVLNSSSTTTASLISTTGFAFRSSGAVLRVAYKASSTVSSGSLSSQDIFISADLDPTLSNNFTDHIVLPLSGSSNSIPSSGCPASGSVGTSYTQVVPAGVLIGDGTWRTISINLPAYLPSSGFDVMIRACLSTSQGFVGQLDLELASAAVILTGPASNFVMPSFSYSGPGLGIGLLPQATFLSSGVIGANLTMSLILQRNSSIGWENGFTFAGAVSAPSSITVNDSALAPSAIIGAPRFEGILVASAVSGFANSGSIDGTVGSVSATPGAALLLGGSAASPGNGGPFALGLQNETFQVKVVDANSAGVSGVEVVPSVDGITLPISAPTNGLGEATLNLVPWTFQFNATYQGEEIGSSTNQDGLHPFATVSSDLYNITLVIKDNRGGDLVGAQLSLSLGNYTFSGTSGDQGRYSFEGISNSLYSLTVYVGPDTYFTGQVNSIANNAVIQVTTSYVTPYTQLLIVVLVAIIPVVVVAAFVLVRRLRRAP